MGDADILERYDQRENQLWLGKLVETILLNVLPYVKSKKILDAGCGSAWAERILIDNGACLVDAFDVEKEMINYAKSLNIPRVSFSTKDFNKSGFKENYYDVAISIEVLEHLERYDFYFSNLVKALKQGGLLFLSSPNKKLSGKGNPYHLKEFTIKEMKKLFGRHSLEIIKLKGVGVGRLSKVAGNVLPGFAKDLIKKIDLYKFLVKKLADFPISDNPANSETVIYLAKKLSF